MNEANIKGTKEVIKAMSKEEQEACAEALTDEVIVESVKQRFLKYSEDITELKKFVRYL